VEAFGHRLNRERTAGRRAGKPRLDAADRADAAVPDQLAGHAEPAVGTLLAAGLEDAPGLFRGPDDLSALLDRQRERLFAVHVFAGPHRRDRDHGVPVVRRADDHGVEVGPRQKLAVVLRSRGVRTELLTASSRWSASTSHTASTLVPRWSRAHFVTFSPCRKPPRLPPSPIAPIWIVSLGPIRRGPRERRSCSAARASRTNQSGRPARASPAAEPASSRRREMSLLSRWLSPHYRRGRVA
jgi:hypothetical protein